MGIMIMSLSQLWAWDLERWPLVQAPLVWVAERGLGPGPGSVLQPSTPH